MSSTKHEKGREDRSPFQSDLDRNPGIGQSKGTFATGEDTETIESENTVEGDRGNDSSPAGAAPESLIGRTNK